MKITKKIQKLFNRNPKSGSLKRRKQMSQKSLEFSKLEPRQLLAGITLQSGVLQIDGSNGNDFSQVNVVGNNLQVTLTGFASETFASSSVEMIEFIGRWGNDTFINNTSTPSTALGHRGADRLVGGSGRDVMRGGSDNDTIDGKGGNDFLAGNSGDDNITAGAGDDTVRGGNDIDTIVGTSGANRLFGDEGGDTITGGTEADQIWGGDGDDTLRGNGGNDRIWGGIGNDIMNGGAGNDLMGGFDGNDTMNGDAGADRMYGQNGNDEMFGGDGIDRIFGQAGDDTIQADRGYDYTDGGAGTDIANYNFNSTQVNLSLNGTTYSMTDGGSGVEIAAAFESLQFNDRTIPDDSNPGGGDFEAVRARIEAESFRLLNAYRTSQGEAALTRVGSLDNIARGWARTIANGAIDTPNSPPSALDAKLLTFGVNGHSQESARNDRAENLGWRTGTVDESSGTDAITTTHRSWIGSRFHQPTMVEPLINEVGIGVVFDATNGRWFVVHHFSV